VATSKKDPQYELAKADAFSDVIKDTLSYIKRTSNVEVHIDSEEFLQIDSSDIKPEHWHGLINIIADKYDDYDSFVITHGTNTLGYTCAALSFALVNPGKPIILTGSQVPINQPGSDAKTNLDNAIRVATWQHDPIKGVLCVFGSHIITGTRVKKDTEFDYDAFKTFQSGSIGRIGRSIAINKTSLVKHNQYLQTAAYPIAKRKAYLRCENDFNTMIVSLTEFPGMNPDILKGLHNDHQIRRFIIRAFGAGDLSTSFLDVLRFLKEKQVPVVVTTQAPNGNATLQVNEPGQRLAEEELVIPAFDMSIESQTAKLSWLLAKLVHDEITYAQLKEKMKTDMKGEINVIWECEYGIM
jgi:L-asparaginase